MEYPNKITILLADDEQLVLDDISRLISWEELGFTIVGKARSGRQALSMFKTFRPQIVITDIIMPLMDGIELIQEIKKIEADTCFLVLSSYDDFSYAKSALRLGVTDYLLKTEITSSSLEAMMLKLSAEIQNASQTKRQHNSLELADFFRFRDSNAVPAHSFVEHHKKQPYLFFVCSVPSLLHKKLRDTAIPVFEKNFADTFSDSLGLSDYDFSFYIDKWMILGIQCSSSPYADTIRLWLMRIHKFFLSCELNCAVLYTPSPLTIGNFKKEYCKWKNALEYTLFFPEDKYINIQKVFSLSRKEAYSLHIPAYDEFKEIVKKENGKEQLTNWALQVHSQRDFSGFRQLFFNACAFFHKIPETEILSVTTYHSFEIWLESNYDSVSSPGSSGFEHCSSHVKNAVLYMEQHYMKSTLSIEEIAENCGISGGRLSVLFKKEVEKTINEVLTDIRIKHAISMLVNSNYKIYEIADRVGYSSSQYFSQIFYSHTGRKPLDFRKNSLTQITIDQKGHL